MGMKRVCSFPRPAMSGLLSVLVLGLWPAGGLGAAGAENLAKGRPVRASSVHPGTEPELAVDGRVADDSRWLSAGGPAAPHWLEIEFDAPVELGSAHLYSGWRDRDAIADFDLQAWSAGQWQTIDGASVRGNGVTARAVPFAKSVRTERVRLKVYDRDHARVRELALFGPHPEGTPPLDTALDAAGPLRTPLRSPAATERTGQSLVLWDNRAAPAWDRAYPVGSGRLGALPLGTYPEEQILINDETIWHRSPSDERLMPEDSFEHLEEIRRLEAAGKYSEAHEYFRLNLHGNYTADSYQFFGWVNIHYDAAPIVSVYRELDLETGMALHIFTLEDETVIRQKVFASAPDDVIAVQITSNRDIEFGVSIEGSQAVDGELVREGVARGTDATRFIGRLHARTESPVRAADSTLRVGPTRQASLYLAVATDYHYDNAQQKRTDDWQADASAALAAIADKPCDTIKQDAIADHAQYFSRVSAHFGSTEASIRELPTRERLGRLRGAGRGGEWHMDPELIETYFQFGRYLLIASSRPGSLPANLQGVWNPHVRPPWNSDYHLNINLQMNYWPAETANLPEMHTPLLKLIELFQPTGREMARRLGMEGWCMPHATDVWAHARLFSRSPHYGGSFLSGQWLTQHIYEHYRFSRDPQVLQQYWDILTSATRFAASWLIPGPNEGELMGRPAVSPENLFQYTDEAGEDRVGSVSAGNSYDQFLIMQSFSDYLEAAEVLGKMDDPFVQQVAQMLPKVYRPRIGEDGRLMEWRLPFRERDPGHRHISHVIGAYPGNQINLDNDPEMREAVTATIWTRLARGGAGTGWSRAWTIGVFARLSQENDAYNHLIHILRRSTLDNLWDTHPPFQIDGNFGATAAVIEMLLHSHNNEIKLLPALPSSRWPDGHIKGLRARGDYTVDIVWRDGKLDEATITAGANAEDQPVKVVYGDRSTRVNVSPGASVTIRGDAL